MRSKRQNLVKCNYSYYRSISFEYIFSSNLNIWRIIKLGVWINYNAMGLTKSGAIILTPNMSILKLIHRQSDIVCKTRFWERVTFSPSSLFQYDIFFRSIPTIFFWTSNRCLVYSPLLSLYQCSEIAMRNSISISINRELLTLIDEVLTEFSCKIGFCFSELQAAGFLVTDWY